MGVLAAKTGPMTSMGLWGDEAPNTMGTGTLARRRTGHNTQDEAVGVCCAVVAGDSEGRHAGKCLIDRTGSLH